MADVQTATPLIQAHALARHVRMSPQKARLVIDLIRGQRVQEALQTLRFTLKRAANPIEKVLRSAVANAERKAEDAGAPLDVSVTVSEHHVAAAERVASNVAEQQANKGVRGTARRVRKALTGKQQAAKKGKKG
jgi:ribosomal protein L22